VWHKSNSVAKNWFFSLTHRERFNNLRGHLLAMGRLGWSAARRGARGAAVVFALAAAGCATMSASPEKVVEQRAAERWNAIVAGDLKRAYEFISPAGRALVSEDAYQGSIRRGFHKSARVTNVRCSSSELCEVTLELEYEQARRRFKTPLYEKWVRQDSNWWFLYER
jgi:hypothetical protein